jgi:hypothetical protein
MSLVNSWVKYHNGIEGKKIRGVPKKIRTLESSWYHLEASIENAKIPNRVGRCPSGSF